MEDAAPFSSLNRHEKLIRLQRLIYSVSTHPPLIPLDRVESAKTDIWKWAGQMVREEDLKPILKVRDDQKDETEALLELNLVLLKYFADETQEFSLPASLDQLVDDYTNWQKEQEEQAQKKLATAPPEVKQRVTRIFSQISRNLPTDTPQHAQVSQLVENLLPAVQAHMVNHLPDAVPETARLLNHAQSPQTTTQSLAPFVDVVADFFPDVRQTIQSVKSSLQQHNVAPGHAGTLSAVVATEKLTHPEAPASHYTDFISAVVPTMTLPEAVKNSATEAKADIAAFLAPSNPPAPAGSSDLKTVVTLGGAPEQLPESVTQTSPINIPADVAVQIAAALSSNDLGRRDRVASLIGDANPAISPSVVEFLAQDATVASRDLGYISLAAAQGAVVATQEQLSLSENQSAAVQKKVQELFTQPAPVTTVSLRQAFQTAGLSPEPASVLAQSVYAAHESALSSGVPPTIPPTANSLFTSVTPGAGVFVSSFNPALLAAQGAVLTSASLLKLDETQVVAARQVIQDVLSQTPDASQTEITDALKSNAHLSPTASSVIAKSTRDALKISAEYSSLAGPSPAVAAAVTAVSQLRSKLDDKQFQAASETVAQILSTTPSSTSANLAKEIQSSSGLSPTIASDLANSAWEAYKSTAPIPGLTPAANAVQGSVVALRNQLKLTDDQVILASHTAAQALSQNPNTSTAALINQIQSSIPNLSPAVAAVIAQTSTQTFSSAMPTTPLVTPSPALYAAQGAVVAVRQQLKLTDEQFQVSSMAVAQALSQTPDLSAADLVKQIKTAVPDLSQTSVSVIAKTARNAYTTAIKQPALFTPPPQETVTISPQTAQTIISSSQTSQLSKAVFLGAQAAGLPFTAEQNFRIASVIMESSSKDQAISSVHKVISEDHPDFSMNQSLQYSQTLVTASQMAAIPSGLSPQEKVLHAVSESSNLSATQNQRIAKVILASKTQSEAVEGVARIISPQVEGDIPAKAMHIVVAAKTAVSLTPGSTPTVPAVTSLPIPLHQSLSAVLGSSQVDIVVQNKLFDQIPSWSKLSSSALSQEVAKTLGPNTQPELVTSVSRIVEIFSPNASKTDAQLRPAIASYLQTLQPTISMDTQHLATVQQSIGTAIKNASSSLPPSSLKVFESVSPLLSSQILANPYHALPKTVDLITQVSGGKLTQEQTIRILSPVMPALKEAYPELASLHTLIATQMPFKSSVTADNISLVRSVSPNAKVLEKMSQENAAIASQITLFKLVNPEASAAQTATYLKTLLPQLESRQSLSKTQSTTFINNVSLAVSGYNLRQTQDLFLQQGLTTHFISLGFTPQAAATIAKEGAQAFKVPFLISGYSRFPGNLNPDQVKQMQVEIFRQYFPVSWEYLSTHPQLSRFFVGPQLSQPNADYVFSLLHTVHGAPHSLNPDQLLKQATGHTTNLTQYLGERILHSPRQAISDHALIAFKRFSESRSGQKIIYQFDPKFYNKFAQQYQRLFAYTPGSSAKLGFRSWISQHPSTLRGHRILSPLTKPINQISGKAAQKIASSAMGKAVAGTATKVAAKLGLQAALQAAGSTVPIIGNIIAFVVGEVLGWVAGKLLELTSRVSVWLKREGAPLAASIGVTAATVVAPVIIFFRLIPLAILSFILAPAILIFFIVPTLVVLFTYIINTSSYVVPFSPWDITTNIVAPAPGSGDPGLPPGTGPGGPPPGPGTPWPTHKGGPPPPPGPGSDYPMCWPHRAVINYLPNCENGWHCGGETLNHNAFDIDCDLGGNEPIYATHDGTAVASHGWSGGYGNSVKITSPFGFTTVYGHMSDTTFLGTRQITAGTLLGWCDSTGNSTGPHLHYGIDPFYIRDVIPPEDRLIQAGQIPVGCVANEGDTSPSRCSSPNFCVDLSEQGECTSYGGTIGGRRNCELHQVCCLENTPNPTPDRCEDPNFCISTTMCPQGAREGKKDCGNGKICCSEL